MSKSSNKAIISIFVFLLIAMCGFFVLTQNYKENEKKEDGNKPSTETKKETNKKVEKIGEVSNIKLYVTDYVYNPSINGYVYTEVNINDEDKTKFKDAIKDVELTSKKEAVVYGKFKLVLDEKIIYFDLDNDYALYSNLKTIIKLPNTTKTIIANSNDKCPCCKGDNCKINLCACSNK